MDISFRPAEPEEATELAAIIQETSGGLVDFTLKGIIPATSPLQILTTRVYAKDSIYSYRNMVVCEEAGKIIGMLLAYPWDQQVSPKMLKRFIPAKRLAVLEDLFNSAEPDSLFVNTFWVAEQYRGEGLADVLMDLAADWARKEGFQRLSLHVWKENRRAVKFYERHGFAQTKSFPFPPHKLLPYEGGKLQLCKDLEDASS